MRFIRLVHSGIREIGYMTPAGKEGTKVKIDIGCGENKQPGYFGIDKKPFPCVDLVCDVNDGIGLSDNSVDYVMASNFIQYVDDLLGTMREIYRICRHKAVVCLLAPYAHSFHNIANPYYRHLFNEHTHHFFSQSQDSSVIDDELEMFHGRTAGLSAEEDIGMDFRLVRRKFFYLPEYQSPMIDEVHKESMRRTVMNVVDEILLYLVVVKSPISTDELLQIGNGSLEEPLEVTYLRVSENNFGWIESPDGGISEAEIFIAPADTERQDLSPKPERVQSVERRRSSILHKKLVRERTQSRHGKPRV